MVELAKLVVFKDGKYRGASVKQTEDKNPDYIGLDFVSHLDLDREGQAFGPVTLLSPEEVIPIYPTVALGPVRFAHTQYPIKDRFKNLKTDLEAQREKEETFWRVGNIRATYNDLVAKAEIEARRIGANYFTMACPVHEVRPTPVSLDPPKKKLFAGGEYSPIISEKDQKDVYIMDDLFSQKKPIEVVEEIIPTVQPLVRKVA